MEYGQQKQRAYQEVMKATIGDYPNVASSASLKTSAIEADLDGFERELHQLIDEVSILKQRLNPVLCSGFDFIEQPCEPMRDGSPISHRLNVFRAGVREAINRIQSLKNGLEI